MRSLQQVVLADNAQELRPTCSGCTRYPHECIYYPTRATARPVHQVDSDSSTPSDSKAQFAATTARLYGEASLDDLDLDRRRVLELFLLHKFSSEVHQTFTGFRNARSGDVQRWVADAVNHALLHEFLLHSIFAVTALYLVLEPDSMREPTKSKYDFDFAKIHHMYLNIALREQQDALSNVNASNAEALCWASFVATYISLGLFPEDDGNGAWIPGRLLSMQQGIVSVYRATTPFLAGTLVREYSLSNSGPDFLNPDAMYDYNYPEALRKLLDFDDGIEILDEETYGVYNKVLAYIKKTYEAIVTENENSHPVYRRLTAFGAMVPKQFIDFVSQQRPRALAILAHHFAMVKYMDRICWFRGLAERHVFGTQSRLPPQWQWAMERPLEMFEEFSVLRPLQLQQAIWMGDSLCGQITVDNSPQKPTLTLGWAP